MREGSISLTKVTEDQLTSLKSMTSTPKIAGVNFHQCFMMYYLFFWKGNLKFNRRFEGKWYLYPIYLMSRSVSTYFLEWISSIISKKIFAPHYNAPGSRVCHHMWQKFHHFFNIWAKFVKYMLRKLGICDRMAVAFVHLLVSGQCTWIQKVADNARRLCYIIIFVACFH